MIWPSDIVAILQIKYLRSRLHERTAESPAVERCWELLRHSSRSFVAVIEELHPDMRNAMMIFYLVLRGLDTIEDDTGLDPKVKLPLLRNFRRVALTSKTWTFNDSSPTEKDRVVLQEFDRVLEVFHNLPAEYQDVIADIAHKMGNGMADYAGSDSPINRNGVPTVADYDLYCHHVAGIVGEGITRMALIAGFATPVVAENPSLYESMGQFLQKTNIIRDYREDLDDGRSFWPQEVWKKHASSLSDFVTDKDAGQRCVSELVLLSLKLVPELLEYLSNVKEPSLFRFCAIPQVMSIATLELVFQNPAVFDRNVKISKGLACQLILASESMAPVYEIFRDFVTRIHQRNRVDDPNYFPLEQQCAKIVQYIDMHDKNSEAAKMRRDIVARQGTRTYFGIFTLTPDETEAAKILLAAAGVGLAIMALMMGVSMLFGARYPNPLKVLPEFAKSRKLGHL